MPRRSARLLEKRLGKGVIEDYCEEMDNIEKDKSGSSNSGEVSNAELKVQLNTIMEGMQGIIQRLVTLEGDKEGRNDRSEHGRSRNGSEHENDDNATIDADFGGIGIVNRGGNNRQPIENLPKMSVPIFKGSSEVDEYIDWKDQMERFFGVFTYTEPRKVDLAISEFKDYASTWWKEQERKRRLLGYPRAATWNQLVRLMDVAFIPPTYDRDVRVQLQELKQGSLKVKDYYHELIKLSLKARLPEDDLAMQARFLQGLNTSIRHRLAVLDFETMAQMLQKAIIIEDQFREVAKERSKSGGFQSFKGKESFAKKFVASSSNGEKKISASTKVSEVSGNEKKGKSEMKTSQVECFKCKGRGHYANKCPNTRVMVIKGGEIDSESEGEDEGESGLILHSRDSGCKELEFRAFEDSESDDEHVTNFGASQRSMILNGMPIRRNLVVSRLLSAQPQQNKEMEQRRNIFHTRTKVLNKSCLVIVDGGSCTNCVSTDFVEKLDLPTSRHVEPYRLQWLDDRGEIKVTRQCRVLLNFGLFSDEILCDVVPMLACNVLLGRPWEFDRRVVKDGFTNVYRVKLDADVHCSLYPMTPSEIFKSQEKMFKEKNLK